MTHRLRIAALPALLTLSIVVLGVYSILGPTTSRAHAAGQAQPFTHQKSNVAQAILDSGDGQINLGEFKNPPSPICSTSTPTSSAANVNTDCELTAPHNETTLAVNPTNPLNIIASANDYQLVATPGGTVKETIFSRAHVTFDGGKTWTTYPINYKSYIATGDPAVAFDARHRLSFHAGLPVFAREILLHQP